jgi:hypothetical protein
VTGPQGIQDKLEDQDYPAYTMGRAADLLGVQPAFLRSLDAAGRRCCISRVRAR